MLLIAVLHNSAQRLGPGHLPRREEEGKLRVSARRPFTNIQQLPPELLPLASEPFLFYSVESISLMGQTNLQGV